MTLCIGVGPGTPAMPGESKGGLPWNFSTSGVAPSPEIQVSAVT
jgi:hypothetical protein